MTSPFADLHVAVTGGTGALGTVMVAVLLEQGATCHMPNLAPAELDGWAQALVPAGLKAGAIGFARCATRKPS